MDPVPARPLYFAIVDDAHDEMHEICAGLNGEWVERELERNLIEWGFYELDARGELVQVLHWTLSEETLIFNQT